MNPLRLFLLAFMLLGVLPIAPSQAAGGIAIVDVQRLLQAASSAKSVQQQLETQRSKFQTEIAAEEADLREAEQKLAKTGEAGKTEAYDEQEQKLQQRFLTVERQVQARRKALDQALTDSMNVVRKNLIDIVSQVSKEKGITLAIVKQQVIWNDSAIDITDEVLTRLDKVLPHVAVTIAPDEAGMENEKPVALKRPPVPKATKKK
ncbi:MAG: OmpH family outer membrane protein [Bdellovibrionales bacterium]|jgi:Skp family chaperone for outer membrane proteins